MLYVWGHERQVDGMTPSTREHVCPTTLQTAQDGASILRKNVMHNRGWRSAYNTPETVRFVGKLSQIGQFHYSRQSILHPQMIVKESEGTFMEPRGRVEGGYLSGEEVGRWPKFHEPPGRPMMATILCARRKIHRGTLRRAIA